MNRSAPVFNSQTVHTFKFPGVISHNNQSPTAGMTCDHLIKWPDRASLTGKFCSYLAAVCGCGSVVIQNINAGNKSLDPSEITFRHLDFSAPYISSIRVTELIHILPWFRLKRSLTLAGLFFIVKMQMLVSSINFSIRMTPFPACRAVPCYP